MIKNPETWLRGIVVDGDIILDNDRLYRVNKLTNGDLDVSGAPSTMRIYSCDVKVFRKRASGLLDSYELLDTYKNYIDSVHQSFRDYIKKLHEAMFREISKLNKLFEDDSKKTV